MRDSYIVDTPDARNASEHRSLAAGIDETDVLLLDALHANPRISFEKLGPILGLSPATVGRRWQRLVDAGRAWVSSVPGPQLALVGAVYEVRAFPGRAVEVAQELARIPEVISVYATDGTFDLHALVLASDMHVLGVLLLEYLPRIPGIAEAVAHVATEWHSGIHWRLGAIDTSQKQSVVEAPENVGRAATRDRDFEPADRDLFLALQNDGRNRYRDLARQLTTSEQLVRRRLDRLVRRGMISFRTDFTRREGGWPTEFVLWLTVPAHKIDEVGAAISEWPETRICVSVVGAANLMVMAQVHRPVDVVQILDRLRLTQQQAQVTDQRIVLRAFKSWGRLLDTEGHAIGVVPVDPWARSSSAPG
nr:Lrp/AsnC family transcriptional regulator [Antrihabitans stalactiti]